MLLISSTFQVTHRQGEFILSYNFQLFGGRGASGGAGGSGGGFSYKETDITEEDWYDWQLDPEPFQDALAYGTVPSYGAEGKRLSREEQERIYNVAHQMQINSERTIFRDITTVYRGESYDSLNEAMRRYKTGTTIKTNKLTSYTTSKSVASEYAGAGERAIKVLHIVTNSKGTVGLKVPNSNEIVSPKGLSYRVTSTDYNKSTGLLKAYLFGTNKRSRK